MTENKDNNTKDGHDAKEERLPKLISPDGCTKAATSEEKEEPEEKMTPILAYKKAQTRKAVFDMLDKNKDGKVHVSDIVDFMKNFNMEFDSKEIENSPSFSQRPHGVTFSEFNQMMCSAGTSELDSEIRDLCVAFDQLDTNKDGLLTRDEVRMAMKNVGSVDCALLEEMDPEGKGEIDKYRFLKALLSDESQKVIKREGNKKKKEFNQMSKAKMPGGSAGSNEKDDQQGGKLI